MKLKLIYTFLLFGITISGSAQKKPAEIIFLHPSPGSKYINIESTVILKLDESLQSKLSESLIQFIVKGEKSGYHTGKIIISGNTIIFDPDNNFETPEIVNVWIKSALFKNGNEYLFSFETSSLKEYDLKVFQSVSDIEKQKVAYKPDSEFEVYGKAENINGVSVPADFPKMDITVSNETAEGKIFIANWGGTSYMMILENDGTPYFYKRFSNSNQTRDFKVQPTGTLTRLAYDLGCYVEMDSQYVNIDTLRCKNGYGTDEHECQILPDHHFFLIGLDYQNVDMSQLVSGGNPNATVIGNTVQELDENHNVVFEWRSWDNFEITDAVHENLTDNTIDYVHMNSIAIDYDSNIVISSRHLSEVTKINRKTGEIMWRLGGEKNQFTFINDSYGIAYQHDARPVPGKPDQYTIFDDGNYRSPGFSRVVEYKIDTVNMTATKVWEHRHSPDYYTGWMGNAQRLSNGNTFIDWSDGSLPKAYEVTPTGEIVYSANFENNYPCYRAFRFDWESVVKVPYLIAESYSDKVTLIFNKFGDKKVEKYIIYGGLSQNPTTPLDSTSSTSIDLTNLANNGRYYFRVTARDSIGTESPFSNQESVMVNFVPAGENFIVNGDFSNGTDNWIFNLQNNGQAQGSVVDGEFYVNIANGGSNYYDVQLIQESFPIINGKTYLFEFDARADSNRLMEPRVVQNGGSFIVYSKTGPVLITPQVKHFKYSFEMTDPTDNNARVVLNCGTSVVDCYIDNVSVKEELPNDMEDNSPEITSDFFLYPNYPNPFNPSTTIQYKLPQLSEVTIEIYNILGEKLAEFIELKKAGLNKLEFNGSNLVSGIYFYRIEARSILNGKLYTAVNKMLLIK